MIKDFPIHKGDQGHRSMYQYYYFNLIQFIMQLCNVYKRYKVIHSMVQTKGNWTRPRGISKSQKV